MAREREQAGLLLSLWLAIMRILNASRRFASAEQASLMSYSRSLKTNLNHLSSTTLIIVLKLRINSRKLNAMFILNLNSSGRLKLLTYH